MKVVITIEAEINDSIEATNQQLEDFLLFHFCDQSIPSNNPYIDDWDGGDEFPILSCDITEWVKD